MKIMIVWLVIVLLLLVGVLLAVPLW